MESHVHVGGDHGSWRNGRTLEFEDFGSFEELTFENKPTISKTQRQSCWYLHDLQIIVEIVSFSSAVWREKSYDHLKPSEASSIKVLPLKFAF